MRVILSRKGFDSQYGGMPSPILPDGTLLSLPIPSKTDMETKYRDLYYGNSSYYDIIHTLSPNNKIKEEYNLNDKTYNELYKKGGLIFHLKFIYP